MRNPAVLLAALRRLVVLVVLAGALTAACSVVLGLLLGASVTRSLTLGYYLVGCFLLVLGFLFGNRGPARVKSETPGHATFPFTMGGRTLRWATAGEQHESINNSAVFITLGLILVVIGSFVDPTHSLF